MIRKLLSGVALAAGLCACGPTLPEPKCLEYQTIVEIPFTPEGKWNIQSTYPNNSYPTEIYTDGCLVESPCPGDSPQHYVLGERYENGSIKERTYALYQSVSIPPESRVDRISIQGNAYGREVRLEVKLEDYEGQQVRLEEGDDCSLDSMIIDYWNRDDYHLIANDGSTYLKIYLLSCWSSPERPLCEYTYKRHYYDKEERVGTSMGCIGLSKVVIQQCVRKRVYGREE